MLSVKGDSFALAKPLNSFTYSFHRTTLSRVVCDPWRRLEQFSTDAFLIRWFPNLADWAF
jgi:hypothetical protein